jgi:coniferyl-aldehyde dehydrogenase
MAGKTLNAGQICLAPDYVLAPRARRDEFVTAARQAVARMFPTLKNNPDYTAIINQRHYDRLTGYLDEARGRGAVVVTLNPADEDFAQQPFRKIAPTLVLEPDDDLKVMQDEIFGPILPVKSYDGLDEALKMVAARPRPLAAYYFGNDRAEQDRFLARTMSGSVAINDVVMQYTQDDLPFGGIGPSGMGAYHGVDGFRTFSHARAVFGQSKRDLTGFIRPPYGAAIAKLLKGNIRR